MQPRRYRRTGAGAIIFGLILLGVGGYYLLRNTLGLGLPELDGEAIWPVIVVAIGLVIVFDNLQTRGGETPPSA